MTSDPYQASGGAGEPSSWNRIAYVQDDPVNFIDSTGLVHIGGCLTVKSKGVRLVSAKAQTMKITKPNGCFITFQLKMSRHTKGASEAC